MKTLTELEKQVFLVAKGHYGCSNRIETLRRVIEKLCAVDSVPNDDLFDIVKDAFIDHVAPSHQKDALRWCFSFGVTTADTVSKMEMTKRFLSAISTVEIVDNDGKLLYDFDPTKIKRMAIVFPS